MRELIERIKRATDQEWPASFDDYSPRNLRDLLREALAFLEGAEAELKAVARGCAAAIRVRGSAREI